MKINFKKILSYFFLILLIAGIYLATRVYARLYPSPRIEDSPTTFIGFNHIGISVKNLDSMLEFYQNATGFELLERITISENKNADILFNQEGITFERAVLKGSNMLLELTEYANQSDTIIKKMLPQGPGMTHTCYQTPTTHSGYDRFKKAGVEMLSRGDQPVDIGGYGVTYAYAYDPEGNIVELEQMSDLLIKLQIGTEWAQQNSMWMTQVAIMSHDLPRLTSFYQKVLDIEPYRIIAVKENSKLDDIANIDHVALNSSWFGMDSQGKKMELMQYTNPATSPLPSKRKITDLGYTFSFEVGDIQKEYNRLKNAGVEFISEPQILNKLWIVFAHDIDGNIFSLRQPVNKTSIYSLKNL